jgi:hypothetical protein
MEQLITLEVGVGIGIGIGYIVYRLIDHIVFYKEMKRKRKNEIKENVEKMMSYINKD